MTAWRDSIGLTINVGFDTDPYEAFASPTDVSADNRGLHISHGRTSLDSGLGVSEMALTLGSRSRQYDPDYASGAHFGELVKGKRIAVGVTLGAFSATLFTGFVQRWNHHLLGQKDAVVEVPCVSGSGSLDSSVLPASAYADEVLQDSPIRYWPLQDDLFDEIATTELPYSPTAGRIEGALGEMSSNIPVGENGALFGGASADSYYQTAPGDWSTVRGLEFWIYVPSLSTATTNVTNVIVYSADDGVIGIDFDAVSGRWQLSYDNPTDNVRLNASTTKNGFATGIHHVAIRATATALTFLVDGSVAFSETFSLTAASPGSSTFASTSVAISGAVSHIAMYATAPSEARLVTHYNAGRWAWSGAHGVYGWETGGGRIDRALDDCDWPTADRDIDNGGTFMGPYIPASGNAVDYLHQIEQAEQGVVCFDKEGRVRFVDRQSLWAAAAVCTFSDDGAAAAVKYAELELDTGEIYNVVTATWSNGTTGGAVTVRDQTSIDSYTASHNTIDPGTTISQATTSATLAAYRLREDKDPHSYPRTLRCHVRRGTASVVVVQVQALCALQMGDVVSVEYTPMGLGSQVVKRAVVIGVEHDITLEEWDVTVHLAPAPTAAADAPYLTVANATTGKVGAAFGNKSPY